MKTLLIILLAACFASCSASYSPLDNYIKASNYSDSAKEAYKIEMKKWIDSTNGAIIVIHNRRKF